MAGVVSFRSAEDGSEEVVCIGYHSLGVIQQCELLIGGM